MNTIDLHIPGSEGISARPVVGPGSPFDDVGFSLWLCCVDSYEPVGFHPFPDVAEQVLFVAEGAGALQQAALSVTLRRHQVLRLPVSSPLQVQKWGDGHLLFLYLASPLPPLASETDKADLETMEGIRFPACRWGRSITNGASPIKASGFTCGLSILAPKGGQVPWHNHPDRQNEVYIILSGQAQMCVGDEVCELAPPAAAFIPGHQWHQLTNLDPDEPLHMIYCYEGSVAAPHWWQERDGVLPGAGRQDNPPLPAGAFPQCTTTDDREWARIAAGHF